MFGALTINMRVVMRIVDHSIHLYCGLINLMTTMKLLPAATSDNCVTAFWALLLLTFINLIYFAQSVTPLRNETDRLQLLAFKDRISDDPNSMLNSWNDSIHFCMWGGVTCSRRHPQRAVALNLSYQSLRGSLSPHIGNLSFLRTIALANNTLEGHIPQEIGQLFRLRHLHLMDNSFIGEITNNLTHCLQLKTLSLYGNKLVSEIPLVIGSLSKLYWLDLANNNLIGHNPPLLWNLSSLTSLYLSENSLDGSISEELGRLVKLQYLFLYQNSFNGEIPKNLTQCLHLRIICLYGSKLVGKIPLGVGSLSKLEYLSLCDNKLMGHIPLFVGNHSSLTYLDLSQNRLDGSIPQELDQLVKLQFLSLGANKLSAKIHSPLYNLLSIQVFVVAVNHLYGRLPPDLGLLLSNLEGLYVGGNRLTGPIPVSLGNASRLVLISFPWNYFSGSLPMNLGMLKGLENLAVQDNQRASENEEEFTFIASLTNCSVLKHLDLSYNQFSGVLPNSIANLSTQLTQLLLGGNQLSGAIPRGLENLANLILLSLGQNLFTGTILIHLMKLKRVLTVCSSIDFSGNDFKALILEYMSNGSLDSWLHQNANEYHQLRFVSLIQRLNVAIDIACAADYLHHHCPTTILHCDLKPSNVLLDDDMVAHVGDFGLARILSDDVNDSWTQTNSLAIRVRYVAPGNTFILVPVLLVFGSFA
ncbi:hypothetical protein MRB53_013926 [Persea americana]|uniref:Uncharacterized protein n=1 Tax=Persea americana TaxID=3435 RepID=A0ACC2K9B2_PERAE|nr:hypothetical protein MRB53_013926 [Persea americana]